MFSFTPAVNFTTAPATPSAIVTADFNNDGNLDLATCADAGQGSVSVLLFRHAAAIRRRIVLLFDGSRRLRRGQ
jgi:hypothetical protein